MARTCLTGVNISSLWRWRRKKDKETATHSGIVGKNSGYGENSFDGELLVVLTHYWCNDDHTRDRSFKCRVQRKEGGEKTA